jgi:hypothetical protein
LSFFKPLIEEVLHEIWVEQPREKKKIKQAKFRLTQEKKLSRRKKEKNLEG